MRKNEGGFSTSNFRDIQRRNGVMGAPAMKACYVLMKSASVRKYCQAHLVDHRRVAADGAVARDRLIEPDVATQERQTDEELLTFVIFDDC